MKFTIKILLGLVVAAAVVATSIPVAEAQCATGSRNFHSISGGNATSKGRVSPAGTWGLANIGSEIGRIWEPTNSGLGNNWCVGNNTTCDPNRLPLPEGVGCPSDDATGPWWEANQTTNRIFAGDIATGDCVLNTCPENDLIFLVEDYGDSAAPPTVGGTAYFIAARTNRDAAAPCAGRQFDLAKPLGQSAACNNTNVNVRPMLEFPMLEIVSSNKVSNDVQVSTNYGRSQTPGAADDAGDSAWGFSQAALPDDSIIATIDILTHTGPSDPGRDRYATCGGAQCTNQGTSGNCCWTDIRQIPYNNAPVTNDQFTIDCGDRTEDIWVSAGLTFQGGGGAQNVKSALVGRAILVQCDPATAVPSPKVRPGSVERRTDRPTRGGGR
jgi:hypothetical protein